MLKRWFGRREPAPMPVRDYRAPDGCRIYAVGDIHGRLDLLRALRGQIQADAASFHGGRRVLIYLGDYVDRGQHNREVIDLLLDHPLAGFEEVHLRGNHEQAFLDFVDDVSAGISWLQFGGAMTLRSYGVVLLPGNMTLGSLVEAQETLRRTLPPRHFTFLQNLPHSHREGDYLFVHAGIRPGIPLGEQEPADLLWIRDEFLACTEDYGFVVVHGHSISDEVEMLPNRIGIDTGAYYSGRLSCLVLEGGERRLLQT